MLVHSARAALVALACFGATAAGSPIRSSSAIPNPPATPPADLMARAIESAGLDRATRPPLPPLVAVEGPEPGPESLGMSSSLLEVPISTRLARSEPVLARRLDADAPRSAPAVEPEPSVHLPEPTSIVLLLTGVVGLFARRRLRREHEVHV